MDAIWFAIAALFNAIFRIMPYLGNIPNIIFIVTIILLLIYWIKYSTRAEEHEEDNYLSR